MKTKSLFFFLVLFGCSSNECYYSQNKSLQNITVENITEEISTIKKVNDLDKDINNINIKGTTEFGKGGMNTKIEAAKICNLAGCNMIIRTLLDWVHRLSYAEWESRLKPIQTPFRLDAFYHPTELWILP